MATKLDLSVNCYAHLTSLSKDITGKSGVVVAGLAGLSSPSRLTEIGQGILLPKHATIVDNISIALGFSGQENLQQFRGVYGCTLAQWHGLEANCGSCLYKRLELKREWRKRPR